MVTVLDRLVDGPMTRPVDLKEQAPPADVNEKAAP